METAEVGLQIIKPTTPSLVHTFNSMQEWCKTAGVELQICNSSFARFTCLPKSGECIHSPKTADFSTKTKFEYL